jgi:anti-sigma factor RsiW
MDYQKLISYAAGDLAGPDAADVEAWLARDPAAAQTVARFRLLRESLLRDECPPADAVERAKAIFHPAAARPAPPAPLAWAQDLVRIVAQLVFDSRAQPALAGLRGGGSGFQLTYDLSSGAGGGEPAELDLQAEPAPAARSWRVVGQVTGRFRDDAMRVDVCRAGSPAAIQTVRSDGRGMFVLSVEPGTYDLHLRLPGRVTVVPGIRMA